MSLFTVKCKVGGTEYVIGTYDRWIDAMSAMSPLKNKIELYLAGYKRSLKEAYLYSIDEEVPGAIRSNEKLLERLRVHYNVFNNAHPDYNGIGFFWSTVNGIPTLEANVSLTMDPEEP